MDISHVPGLRKLFSGQQQYVLTLMQIISAQKLVELVPITYPYVQVHLAQ